MKYSKRLEVEKIKTSLEKISNNAISVLEKKKILFGHASVGKNILDGIKDIINYDERFKNIKIKELISEDKLDTAGIYHFSLKKNGYPLNKNKHFIETV